MDDLSRNLAAQYGWVYGLSVTEMEIVHGAFRKLNPNGELSLKDQSSLDLVIFNVITNKNCIVLYCIG